MWLTLHDINQNITTGCSSWDENGETNCDYPIIQFSSTAAGADDFAWVSPSSPLAVLLYGLHPYFVIRKLNRRRFLLLRIA